MANIKKQLFLMPQESPMHNRDEYEDEDLFGDKLNVGLGILVANGGSLVELI